MRLAYADPPYLGMGQRMYGEHHPDAARWDTPTEHHALLARLAADYDGWAYSCLPRDLAWLLPAAPTGTRVAAWVKTYHQIRPTSVQYAWEPVLFSGGRAIKGRNPMVRDWHLAPATRLRSTPGAKPETFNRWIADLLGYQDGDTLTDLFPGTHGMDRELAQGTIL